MSLKDKTIVVTGGSRGLGLGLVEALVDQGGKVTVVARDKAALAAVQKRLGVAVISADVIDEAAAVRILADARPEVLVLNAGTPPRMGRLDQLSWADFTAPWETDVKGGLYWMQAALNLPLAPGARVLVGSSGAAQQARRSRAATPAPSVCSGSWPSTPMESPSRGDGASASRRSCLCR
jgi:NAD(P)-dependent dehydrogenase (short-subunit alcohol dehydrogenase family)